MDFTGEEGLGRYLDLHALYLQYLNLNLRKGPSSSRALVVANGGAGANGGARGQASDGADKEEGEGGEKPLEYYEYLTSFSDFSGVQRQQRMSKPYRWGTAGGGSVAGVRGKGFGWVGGGHEWAGSVAWVCRWLLHRVLGACVGGAEARRYVGVAVRARTCKC